MLAPNPTNRLHCQHSPTARFESKRAAHQAQWEGVNFGRRSPSSGGQNCTPNDRSTLGTKLTARFQSRSSWVSVLAISSFTIGELTGGRQPRLLIPSKAPTDFSVSQPT